MLLAGDLNSDFMRNSDHCNTVRDFLGDVSLSVSWETFDVDFTAVHERAGHTLTSTIDHFAWSQKVNSAVLDAGVLHLPDNESDHCPIYCTLNLSVNESVKTQDKSFIPKPSWKRATLEDKTTFKSQLCSELSTLTIPQSITNCFDVKCKNKKHREDLDNFTLLVLETVQNVSEQCLPIPQLSSKKHSKQPGWSNEVKPYKDNAYFWHQIWKSAGKPMNNDLHRIMKKTRNQYHFQYKKCCKAKEIIQRNKLLSACLNEEGDLFTEIKKIRKYSSIDGVCDNISNHFSGIYSSLYNSTDDFDALLEVNRQTELKINSSHVEAVRKITPQVLKGAADKLKSGKSDPVYSYSSDCFKHGPDNLYEQLSIILQSFAIHGHVSQPLLLSTLIPLVKDKLGNINSSKNYRSVAISSLVIKLIDWVILLLEEDSLKLNDLQFAYQAGSSTVMCTWAAVETIDFYLNHGSEVYTCATDMSKAFDMTLHSLMFEKMLDAGVLPIFVRLLISIYMNQLANVCWNGEESLKFTVRNGCGQGKVLAALAYCLYVEELFETLRRRKSGCWVRGRYCGIFGYSDDNWLLAPSLESLQDMLNTCQEYAVKHNLKFSTDVNPQKSKTKCMAFLKNDKVLPNMILCGNPLPWVDSLVHLGSTIGKKCKVGKLDISKKEAIYIQKTCSINQEFAFAHPITRLKLNSIYNCHFSGGQLWDLFGHEVKKFYSTYNRSVKAMAGLPYGTHHFFIEPVSNQKHMSLKLLQNFTNFIDSIRRSKKSVLRTLYDVTKNDVRTVTGSNLRNILRMTNLSNVDGVTYQSVVNLRYHEADDKESWRAPLVLEILDIKSGICSIPDGWTYKDLDEILQIACV